MTVLSITGTTSTFTTLSSLIQSSNIQIPASATVGTPFLIPVGERLLSYWKGVMSAPKWILEKCDAIF
jgi:hypothetical protein